MIYVDDLNPDTQVQEVIMIKAYRFVEKKDIELLKIFDDNVLDFFVNDCIKSDKIPELLRPAFVYALNEAKSNYHFDNIDNQQLQYKYF